jgi:hypothetical protein
MIRKWFALLGLVSLMAAPALAGETHNSGIATSRTDLIRSEIGAGRNAVELMATNHVDVNALLGDVDLSTASSPEAIADAINAKRLALYPDEEIILSVGPSKEARQPNTEKVNLVRAIYWWNNTNCSNCYWMAEYTSTTATLFVGRVEYGSYNINDRPGTSGYIYRWTLNSNDTGTLYNYGPKRVRGFRGNANGVSSKTDIVMYFFN